MFSPVYAELSAWPLWLYARHAIRRAKQERIHAQRPGWTRVSYSHGFCSCFHGVGLLELLQAVSQALKRFSSWCRGKPVRLSGLFLKKRPPCTPLNTPRELEN